MTSLKHFLCVYLLVGFSCLINAQSLPAYRVPLSDNGAIWVVLGRTTQEIVAEMKISPGLVKFHLRNMYQKLQVHNRQSFIKKFKK